MIGKCSNPECAAPISCHEGKESYTNCEFWNRENATKQEKSKVTSKGTKRTTIPWSSEALTIEELSQVSIRNSPVIIGVVGKADAGKTTYLAMLFTLLLRGGKFKEFNFCGTKTIKAWDELYHKLNVTKSPTPTTIAGTTIYYSNDTAVYPTSNISELHTINYYDDYNFDLNGGTSTVSYGVTPSTNTKGLATGSKVRVLDTSNWITNVIYYDAKGRPIYNYSKNEYLATISTIKSQLDFVGKTLETTSTHLKNNVTTSLVDAFSYDHAGRLLNHKQTINNQDQEVIATNTYDNLGQLTSKGVGGKNSQNRLQTIDYSYNIRGWLKAINDVNAIGNDLFAFKINYNTPTTGIPLYNGNISQTLWKTTAVNTTGNPVSNIYSYNYDSLNRLSSAIDNTANYNENLSYDKNGNIMGILRKGNTDPNATVFGTMDNLTYAYDNGNKLIKVEDFSGSTQGFNNGANLSIEYTYDDNGNMITDANKGITTDITYNHLNLPTKITFATGNLQYVYDATGIKLEKKVVENGKSDLYTKYGGIYIYEKTGTETDLLKFLSQPEGYIAYNSGTFDYIYQYKDHLGNVRLSYGDANNDGVVNTNEIVEENNYYPFGLKHKGYNGNVVLGKGNASGQKYKYNGKELQDELGLNMYDYGARNYDPALGRWMNIDPMAERYFGATPYNYVLNSPLNSIDPDGMDVYLLTESGKTILALKEKDKKTDTMYAVSNSSITDITTSSGTKDTTSVFDMKDTNGDGQFTKEDGVTVKSGLIGQLGKASTNGDGSYLSTSNYSKENEDNYLSLFKYISDNSLENEFSLHFFKDGAQKKIQLGTFFINDLSPGVPNGSNIKSYHNHSDTNFNDERMSMGDNGRGKPAYEHQANDFNRANSAQISYPNYVYFGKSRRLYNVTKDNIIYIQKINNSNDLKRKQ